MGNVVTRHCAELYGLKFQEIFSNSQAFVGCFESILDADIFNIFSYLQFTVGIRYFSQLNWISTVMLRALSDFTAIFQQLYLVVRMKRLWNRRMRKIFLNVEKHWCTVVKSVGVMYEDKSIVRVSKHFTCRIIAFNEFMRAIRNNFRERAPSSHPQL